MIRKFPRWTKTECDDCGSEFLVTRTEPKTVEGGVKVLCNGCEMYNLGFKDGISDKTNHKQIITDLANWFLITEERKIFENNPESIMRLGTDKIERLERLRELVDIFELYRDNIL